MSTSTKIAEDVYKYLESYPKLSESAVKELADELVEVLTTKLSHYRVPSLSMSSVGKAPRRIYMDINYPVKPSGKDRLKFLYGDIIETFVLWLVKQSGHKVEAQQLSVKVDGVCGSIDAKIDGVLCDVKSCSPRSFTKFSEEFLPTDDPFGYLAQIAGYYKGTSSLSSPFFLAVNKVSGDIVEYYPDPEFDFPYLPEVFDRAKKAVNEYPTTPCSEPEPIGRSGNLKVPTCCKFCPHLKRCWKEAKAYEYSTGTEYLVKIEKEPRVPAKENENEN